MKTDEPMDEGAPFEDPPRLKLSSDAVAKKMLDEWTSPPDPTEGELARLERAVLSRGAPGVFARFAKPLGLAAVVGIGGAAALLGMSHRDDQSAHETSSGTSATSVAPEDTKRDLGQIGGGAATTAISAAASAPPPAPSSERGHVDPLGSNGSTRSRNTALVTSPSAHPSALPSQTRADTPDPLLEENRLVRGARALLESDPAAALERLEEHRSKFTKGELASEREYLTIRALGRAHRIDEARALARTYGARFPNSPYLQGVRELEASWK